MKTVKISTDLLARLANRLEARIPRQDDEDTESDVALVYEAREVLRPSFKRAEDEFASWSLEQMRMAREIAINNGYAGRAFALATAIDIKKGLYK